MTVYDFTEYLRCVFLESDVDVAVLTSNPGVAERRMLFNEELAGTREVVDRLAGTGRLLNHSVVHPNVGETEDMEGLARPLRPSRVEGVHARQARRRRLGVHVATRRRRRTPLPRRGGTPRRAARVRTQGHRVTRRRRVARRRRAGGERPPERQVRDLPLRVRTSRQRRRGRRALHRGRPRTSA